MSIDPDEQRQGDKDLADTLRQLRKAAGLSGERLAVRCSMSQAKISRIEGRKITPTVAGVERILAALEVPGEVASELVALARRVNVQHTSWRAAAEIGLWRKQNELKSLAESSKTVRQFLPAMPGGLLQTEHYARRALSQMVPTDPVWDVDNAVSARLARQETLDDPARSFIFVLTEQALRWKYASREVVAAQCRRIAAVAENPNVELVIVPQSAEVPGRPLNTFVIYDDRLVLVELFSGEVALRDPRDVSHHLHVFEFFLRHAHCGADATAFALSVAEEFMQGRD